MTVLKGNVMRSRQWTRTMWAALALSLAGLTLLPPAGLTEGQTDGPLRFRLQEGDLFPYRNKLILENERQHTR